MKSESENKIGRWMNSVDKSSSFANVEYTVRNSTDICPFVNYFENDFWETIYYFISGCVTFPRSLQLDESYNMVLATTELSGLRSTCFELYILHLFKSIFDITS